MTLRSRLMLVYAAPFFVVGSMLVTVPLLGVRQSQPVGSGHEPPASPQVTEFPVGVWAVSMLVLLVASIALGWVVAGRFVGPLRKITETAKDISANNLHQRLKLDWGRRDELSDLTGTLNGLFVRLEASFLAQRHFVVNASHELRTPLTAERALLQVALADPDASADTLRAACQEVLQISKTQERLIEALLALAGGQHGMRQREEFDLADLTAEILRSQPQRGDLTVRRTLDPAPASGDPRLVESLVTNLVENAMRHNDPDGWIEVVTAPADDGARIVVRNSGPVVPPEDLDRLFEPFQRLHNRRVWQNEGHGLGLAIVRAIAEVHEADLNAWTRPEGGLDIAITFPARIRVEMKDHRCR